MENTHPSSNFNVDGYKQAGLSLIGYETPAKGPSQGGSQDSPIQPCLEINEGAATKVMPQPGPDTPAGSSLDVNPPKPKKARKDYRRFEALMIQSILIGGMLHPYELAEKFGLTPKRVSKAIITAKMRHLLKDVNTDVPYDVTRASALFKKKILVAKNIDGNALVRIYHDGTSVHITLPV